jgi:hypothetical protein
MFQCQRMEHLKVGLAVNAEKVLKRSGCDAASTR